MHRYEYFLMFSSFLIFSKGTEGALDELEIHNRSPLILALRESFYQYPDQVKIQDDQNHEYYSSEDYDIQYFCPIEEKNSSDKYCLVKKKFSKKTEEKICEEEVKPVLTESRNIFGIQENCGSSKNRLYKFAYKICTEESRFVKTVRMIKRKESKIVEEQYPHIYEICYDGEYKEIVYTRHEIMYPKIIEDLRLNEKQKQYKFSEQYSTETYALDILKDVEKQLKAYHLEDLNAKDREYEPRMLVPIDDFALGHWMKTTLHMINYKPQHRSKIAAWDAINSHTRDRLIQLHKSIGNVKIYTGTWGVLRENNLDPVYLANDAEAEVTIPLIWWKLLYAPKVSKAIVIIMRNVNDVDEEQKCEHEKTACDVIKWKTGLDEANLENNVYCCSLPSVRRSILPLREFGLTSSIPILELD